MEVCKILLAVIFAVTLSSVARTAPPNPPPNRVELLIRLGLSPKLTNTTKEIKNVYPVITSNTNLQETMLFLGTVVTTTCSISLQLKDKLSLPYMTLSYFISPLYMAYSYEQTQGPQHTQLAHLLDDTSFYLNSTVSTLRHEIMRNKFQLPAVQKVSETDLDHYTRQYLQTLVDNNLVSLVITDGVVKIYRNYVILYSLRDAISQVYTCVASI